MLKDFSDFFLSNIEVKFIDINDYQNSCENVCVLSYKYKDYAII